MIEDDLDAAEDKLAAAQGAKKEEEDKAEEFERENKQLKRQIETLEGEVVHMCTENPGWPVQSPVLIDKWTLFQWGSKLSTNWSNTWKHACYCAFMYTFTEKQVCFHVLFPI